jgi:hypothetical protein
MHNPARIPSKNCKKKLLLLNPAKLFLSPLQYTTVYTYRCSDVKSGVADPDPDPYVFGPPGS